MPLWHILRIRSASRALWKVNTQLGLTRREMIALGSGGLKYPCIRGIVSLRADEAVVVRARMGISGLPDDYCALL